MNCPKCNAANNPDARFCGSCGCDLQAAAQANTKNEAEEILEVEEPIMTSNVQPEQPAPVMEQPVMSQPVVEQPVMTQYQQMPMMDSAPQQPVMNTVQPVNNIQPPQQPKKSNKSIFIIIGAVVAVIAIVVSVILLLNMSPSEKKQEKEKIDAIFNPEQLIKVKKNDKYGYIDTKGKVVIDTKYEYATDFRGDYAVVRTEVEKEGLTRTIYQIIDNKGKAKKEANLSIEYIEENESWIIDGELYNKSMKKISPEGVRVSHKDDNYFLWVNSEKKTGGIMNEKGKQIYTYNFQEGESSIYLTIPSVDDTQKDTYCIVNVEDKYGLVNCATGVVVRDMKEERISSNTDNIFTIKDIDTYDFKELIYVQDDKIMYQTTNKEIDLYYYPGYVSIRDGSKDYSERYSYLHTATGEVKTERPETTSDDDDEEELNEWESFTGNKKFSCDDGYGLMNDETFTLPCEWQDLEYLEINLFKYLKSNNKEYIYGEKDGKTYLIDLKEKKAIVEFNASYITKKNDTTFIYYTDATAKNRKVYNLLTNKSLSVDSDKSLTVYSNYITVKDSANNKLKYYNTNLEMIYEGDI